MGVDGRQKSRRKLSGPEKNILTSVFIAPLSPPPTLTNTQAPWNHGERDGILARGPKDSATLFAKYGYRASREYLNPRIGLMRIVSFDAGALLPRALAGDNKVVE